MASPSPVTSNNPPYVRVRVRVRGQDREMEALADTGFDGEVVVPANLLGSQEPPDGRMYVRTADGSQRAVPTFLGTIEIGSLGPFDVNMTALGPEFLIGRGLTDRFSLHFDHGQQLTISP